jgi:cytochrome c oxidase cbb3-type subunit 3
MSDPSVEIAEYARPDGAARDGIGEEDNPIPSWFTVSFGLTIVFAALYAPYYLFSGWSQVGQYEEQVILAEARAQATRQALPAANPYRGDREALAAGSQVWTEICVACHKPDGSGLVGPSLVDPYWKYGSTDLELFETVSAGRPGGMPPWGPVLGAEKIWKVLAYLETLPRSDAPGVGSPGYAVPGAPGS